MSDLKDLQCWLQGVIMHPDGPLSDEAGIARLLTPSKQLTAAERLAVYNNAYHVRLLECLREEFPVLRQALGDEAFDAFAYGYLRACPSRSYTLTQLGARFPSFLAETCPADAPPEWSAFLIDLALLEWTFSEVFDGPGVEGEPLFDAAALAAITADDWLQTRLVPVPCLRLLRLRSPVQEHYAAVRRGEAPDPPPPCDTFLAVTRRDYIVRHYPLQAAEFAQLRELVAGRTLGEAMAETAQLLSDGKDAAGLVYGWFQRWTANGFFRAVRAAAAA
jgi:hypothetical protein